jgi:hypothetical protein
MFLMLEMLKNYNMFSEKFQKRINVCLINCFYSFYRLHLHLCVHILHHVRV